jgi:hypothetical protein
MQPHELDVAVAERAREDRIRRGSSGPAEGERAPRPGTRVIPVTHGPADTVLVGERELENLRECFEQTRDPGAKGELAARALEHTERQLRLTRGRRQELDSIEGRLWARRNRLERFLIQTKGRAWWRNHREAARSA